ncbi:MAG: 4-hydroxy-3-methylbut-2-enyl diphosphate reductase [Lachnospiraceae bacterium]|jgi:4-hydroxy-3-methylbut-2-enyl diphosphate reductase
MKVKLAKSAGFCFGVKRAVDAVYKEIEAADGNRRIYTYGPIIHNDYVVADLKDKGVIIIERPEDISAISSQTLIIRSHGVAESIYELAAKHDVLVCDATCPFVKKIHEIVRKRSLEGDHIVIIGDPDHPEVQGIVGWCKGPASVIKNNDEAEKFTIKADNRLCIVSQTTFNTQKFKYFVEMFVKKGYDTYVINTICNATTERQDEAADISKQVDVMLVIGDLRSSNTQKLYEICKSNCKNTYHIQTVRDLQATDLQSGTCVGITAGASTPHYLIQEVLLLCQMK